jgi:hypothetical protein
MWMQRCLTNQKGMLVVHLLHGSPPAGLATTSLHGASPYISPASESKQMCHVSSHDRLKNYSDISHACTLLRGARNWSKDIYINLYVKACLNGRINSTSHALDAGLSNQNQPGALSSSALILKQNGRFKSTRAVHNGWGNILYKLLSINHTLLGGGARRKAQRIIDAWSPGSITLATAKFHWRMHVA